MVLLTTEHVRWKKNQCPGEKQLLKHRMRCEELSNSQLLWDLTTKKKVTLPELHNKSTRKQKREEFCKTLNGHISILTKCDLDGYIINVCISYGYKFVIINLPR